MKYLIIFVVLFLVGCGQTYEQAFQLEKTCILKHGNPIMENNQFKGCDFQENKFKFHLHKEENH